MPVLTQPVTELTQHVFTPICQQLAHRLLAALSYTHVVGDQIYINSDWSTHSVTSDIHHNANLLKDNLRIDLQVQLNPTSQKWEHYTFHHTTAYGIDLRTLNNQTPTYLDMDNRVRLIEMRSPVTMVLNCELHLQSADHAYQTPQQIFNDYETGATIEFNDLVYDYPVPKGIISVLYGIWKQDRRKGKPAGVDFLTYLKKNSNNGWVVNKHREQDQYEIAVPVFDLKTLGVLEYSDDKPNPEMKDRMPVGYTIPFVYTVQFAMPTLNLLQYPAWICNNLLPGIYIPQDKQQRFNNMPEYHHGRQNELYAKGFDPKFDGFVQVPWYDDWVVPSTATMKAYDKSPLMILGILVDEDKEYTEVDLSEDFDPSFTLKDVVKEILYQQGEASTNDDAVYVVSLFREDIQLIPGTDFTFDENLILRFKPTDIHSHYRLVIHYSSNINKIDSRWYPLLKKYYRFLSNGLKNQIRKCIEDGTSRANSKFSWRDPSWDRSSSGSIYSGYISHHEGRKKVFLAEDGWIYDERGHAIRHISEHPYPTYRGENNAYYPDTRVTRHLLIARKASELTS